jgi:hypothetical protein
MRKLLLLLCLVATPTLAADVRVSWTQPVQNTDGSTIPASGAGSIQSNRIEWGTCVGTGFGTAAGSQTIPAATAYTVTGLAPATHCFRVTATNTYGAESGVSNVAQRTVPAPVPLPPVVTTAVIAGMLQTPVYSITAANKLSTLMGFADVGKACVGPVLATYRGAAFREVARSDVKLWGSTTLRLAAPCA